jgi:outer membrane protein assembly factor BamB
MRLAVTLLAGWAALTGCVAVARVGGAAAHEVDWPIYGGDAAADHYSPLTQIDRTNVGRLREAWRFETGEGELQTQPLMIGGTLYGVDPHQGVFALDAATGRVKWRHAPDEQGAQPVRGLTYWTDGRTRRLFSSNGSYLIALDAETGQAAHDFGDDGRIDLREGLGRDPRQAPAYLTTPGVIYGDMIITGFRTSEVHPAAPGAVRAFDVRTGKLRWKFNILPQPGEPGSETWPKDAWKTGGAANNWAGMALDQARGLLFVPTGSPVDDFYGADRIGANLYADSLLALDARTGRLFWHFQEVHHDIWDRDFPSAPVLLTVRRGGKRIDAVAQTTKQGVVYLFDRVTGTPLFPVEERPFPPSDVPGEQAWPTQPMPLKPAPFARQRRALARHACGARGRGGDGAGRSDLPQPMRRLPWARAQGIAAFLPRSDRRQIAPDGGGDGCDHQGRKRADAGLPANLRRRTRRGHHLPARRGAGRAGGPWRQEGGWRARRRGAGLSVHGLSALPRPRRLSGGTAALGDAQRDRSQHRRLSVANPVRRIS